MSMTEKQPLLECIEENAKEPYSLPVTWKSVLSYIYRRISLRRNRFIVEVLYAIFTMLIAGFYILCFYLTGVAKPRRVDIAPVYRDTNVFGMEGYLVYSNHCRIVNLDPYRDEVMLHFRRVIHRPCKSVPPLTQVHYDANAKRYVLSIDATAFPRYKVDNMLSCCYIGVQRFNEDAVNLTKCHTFVTRAQLSNTTDSIIVSCKNDIKQIYINGHPTIPERVAVRQRLERWAHKDRGRRVPSVLMIGIDSISRANLIRAMPKTAQYLYVKDWFELAGYNKIDDNTFPNIMALMVGYNLTNAMKHCNPYHVNGLDKCDFIWKLFQEHGYVTAYGEDAIKINTFNYRKKGFQQPPVDYYLRPYLMAAEKLLGGYTKLGLPHCLGFETEAKHVYNYALEFTQRYRNESFFGFFWTNTHSHSDISQTTFMDKYLRRYLQRLVAQGTMEHSIVVFFSDHGLRFGPTRATWSGHLEERLPFLFIWLPPFVRKAHPEFVEALRQNRNRLTTPYDLHMTLKHILTLSGRSGSLESLGGAKDCPQCQSMLLPVPLNRSCEDVAIEDHWCTCREFKKFHRSKLVKRLANHAVNHINNYIASFRNGSLSHLCVPLKLLRVLTVYKAEPNEIDPKHIERYMLNILTSPNKALYEATLCYNRNLPDAESVQLSGSVSRISSYFGEKSCLGEVPLKKYCHCRRKDQNALTTSRRLTKE
ncbi:uncharacterized protein LOC135431197 isoform X2 [Drosophila montana]|uniref:uncharacterized protein LOC135431197 isoform X2 n=1 Tax=Drosophila montana TaxID=40370 RepID=UPI00313D19C6